MADSKKRVLVPGSEKKALPNAKVVGKLDPNERIEITVIVRPRSAVPKTGKVDASARDTSTQLPEQRQYLSRESFAAERGADPEDVRRVEVFAKEHNLTVVDASLQKRSIRLAGTVSDLTVAFQPNLKKSKMGSRVVRTRTGGISVPAELAPIIVAVMGFDDRPAAIPHVRFLRHLRWIEKIKIAILAAPHQKFIRKNSWRCGSEIFVKDWVCSVLNDGRICI